MTDKPPRCDCNEYQEGMEQIVNAQLLFWDHGMPYTGKPFRYCPWCGKELELLPIEKLVWEMKDD